MATVLLTRPRAASERLARKLERYGHKSIIEPLLVIESLKTPCPDISGINAVMITSSNALETLEGQGVEALFDLPCFCVGESTATRAHEIGFGNVQSAAGDGAELARHIETALPNGKISILHICGRDIDSKAQDELTRSGHRVTGWPVYAAHQVRELTQPTIALFRQRKLDVAPVFSARTAETLKNLMVRNGLEACCEPMIAIGLSEAVADILKPLPWKKLVAAPKPTEDAVIERLSQIHSVS